MVNTLCIEDVRKALIQKDLMDSQLSQKLSIKSNNTLFVKD